MKRFLLSVGLAGTIVLTAVAGSQAAVVTHDYDMPFSATVANPCNGDVVALTGTLDLMVRMTLSGSGRANFGGHLNYDLSGVGVPSGAEYNVKDVENVESNNITFTNGAAAFSDEEQFVVISKGGAPNFVAHLIIHETFNANGDLTSFTFDTSSECRG